MTDDAREFLTYALKQFADQGMENPNLGDAQSILPRWSKFIAIEPEIKTLAVAHGQFKPIRALLSAAR